MSWIWLAIAGFALGAQFNGSDTGYIVIGSIVMSKLSAMHADMVDDA